MPSPYGQSAIWLRVVCRCALAEPSYYLVGYEQERQTFPYAYSSGFKCAWQSQCHTCPKNEFQAPDDCVAREMHTAPFTKIFMTAQFCYVPQCVVHLYDRKLQVLPPSPCGRAGEGSAFIPSKPLRSPPERQSCFRHRPASSSPTPPPGQEHSARNARWRVSSQCRS